MLKPVLPSMMHLDNDMPPSGILPIDKPTGITSHDVVDVIRKLYGLRRVGHTGTLDPAASGLLLIALGRATRVASYLSGQDKTYLATIVFGANSSTGDSEGELTTTGVAAPSPEQLGSIIENLTGPIELDVPAHAAVHSAGKRRYRLARSGQDVPPLKRTSIIHSLEVLRYESPRAEIRVTCASGTYIRSLAAAMGERAGCGAYLAVLRREAVGRVRVEGAFGLDYLIMLHARDETLPTPEAVDDYLALPVIEVGPESESIIHHGQRLTATMVTRIQGGFQAGEDVAIRVQGYGVAAIGKATMSSAETIEERSAGLTNAALSPTEPALLHQIITYQCVLI